MSKLVVICSETGATETLTFEQACRSKLIAALYEMVSEIEPIVVPDEMRYPPAALKLACEYMRAPDHSDSFNTAFFAPFLADPVRMIGLMNVAGFLDYPALLKLVQANFCNHYIKGRTPTTCLEAMGLPGNTVFTADEIASTQRQFPWLCMKHLGGKANENHKPATI